MIKVKLRDSAGLRRKVYVSQLDAVISYCRSDGREFWFRRIGQYDYEELPEEVVERLKLYLKQTKKHGQDLSLAEIDEFLRVWGTGTPGDGIKNVAQMSNEKAPNSAL